MAVIRRKGACPVEKETLPSADYFDGTGFKSKGLHRHEFCELLFVLRGRMHFLADDTLYKVDGPSLIFFRAGKLHTSVVDEKVRYERFNVNFDEAFVTASADSVICECFGAPCRVLAVKENEKDDLRALFTVLTHAGSASSTDPFSREAFRHALCAILAFFSGRLRKSGGSDYLNGSYIADATRYLREHLAEKILIADTAAVFFVSRAKFIADFRAATGVTVGTYLTYERLRKAKEMLRDGASVGDAALACGFGSMGHFIRVFGAHAGMTPYRYAKAHRPPQS